MNYPNYPRCPLCNRRHPPGVLHLELSGPLFFLPLRPPTPQEIQRILRAKKDMHRQYDYNTMGDDFLRNFS